MDTADTLATDSLGSDGCHASASDSGYDENSVDSSVLTSAMLEEEQKLQRKNERLQEKLRREYEKQEYNKQMKELRYKRLMHLLGKSQFYASFMNEKVEKVLSEEKRKKNAKSKEETKRKKRLIEDHCEEIAAACKKRMTESGEVKVSNKSNSENGIKDSDEFKMNAESDIAKDTNTGDKKETRISALGIEVPASQPMLLEGAALRDYQLDGLNWLRILFETGMNGILADEMGLGKTIQIIGLICHLYENDVLGPFLIVGPLSTLPNWLLEFSKFAPQVPVILYHGLEKERSLLRKHFRTKVTLNKDQVLPVILTSYEIPIRDEMFMSQIQWKYIIVDEGHRLKNHTTQLARVLSSFKTVNRMLLTGTPLQNNLAELWSLLHFLLPDVFDSLEAFQAWFHVEDIERGGDVASAFIEQERKDQILTVLHQILTPFLLRRVKSEVKLFLPPKKEVIVYCPLTSIQRQLYETIIDRSIVNLLKVGKEQSVIIEDNPDGTKVKRRSALRKNQDGYSYLEPSQDKENEDDDTLIVDGGMDQYTLNIKIQNVSMLMRKAVNHPYLIKMPVLPGSSILRVDEGIISASGKMIVLDGLLSRLKERKHKVLIFSTFTSVLDLLEEMLIMKSYDYERLDGRSKLHERKDSIYRFNTDEEVFIFLISTRAGGLGINLTAADTVIIFDSDWNPQADLQAQDRCHRIGQTRPVIVYRLVTEGTYDEKIVSRAAAKRKLEKIIIYGGKFNNSMKVGKKQDLVDFEELKELLSKKQHSEEVRTDGSVLSEEQWNTLLDRSDLMKQQDGSVE